MFIKSAGKNILCCVLEYQVKQLKSKNQFKIVAVGGSVGKTSTKLAIARTLSARRRVQYQNGNYNDRLTVPLVVFGHDEPAIYNIVAWVKILVANARILRKTFPYDVIVLELGTDGPGQMGKFAYLWPDVQVITAIASEHMMYFGDLASVAKEELVPLEFAKKALLNVDDIPPEFLPVGSAYESYSLTQPTSYKILRRATKESLGQELAVQLPNGSIINPRISLLGAQGAKIVAATVAVADMLGWQSDDIVKAVASIEPAAGRMRVLNGKQHATILDDTYNASPIAVQAALEVLFESVSQHRIAILGSMNELGDTSSGAHKAIGELCDAHMLDLVVTIGYDAEAYLAPAAKLRGCEVVSFNNPYEAGEFVVKQLRPNTTILAKGSQNGVFAEETVKILLQNPADSVKLVRQSPYWLKIKQQQFSNV